MKKFKGWAWWIVFNAITWFTLYEWLFVNNNLCESAFKFYLWFTVVVSILAWIASFNKPIPKSSITVPHGVIFFVDFCVSLVLAAFGHFWYAAFLIISTLFQLGSNEKYHGI